MLAVFLIIILLFHVTIPLYICLLKSIKTIFIMQPPRFSVAVFCFLKIMPIFASLCTWCRHYILKVFSLSYKKLWKFSRTKDERITLTTCLFMAGNTLIFQCVPSPYHSGVGISIVYFRSGFSTTFLLISVSKPHTFFFVYIHTPIVKKEFAENPVKSRYQLKLIMICIISH